MDHPSSFRDLADSLAADLEHLEAGARLPSENELQRTYGVSRMTTRSALQELERRHLVRRIRGSGTYAALRIPYAIRSGMPPSWSSQVREAGREPSHQLISANAERARASLATTLRIPRGRTVSTITRLGLIDGDIASWHCSRVPLDLAPNLTAHPELEGSLTQILRGEYGLEVERWWSRAELLSVPPRVARALDLTAGEVAWTIESANFCRHRRRPVEYTEAWMRADCFRVFLELAEVEF